MSRHSPVMMVAEAWGLLRPRRSMSFASRAAFTHDTGYWSSTCGSGGSVDLLSWLISYLKRDEYWRSTCGSGKSVGLISQFELFAVIVSVSVKPNPLSCAPQNFKPSGDRCVRKRVCVTMIRFPRTAFCRLPVWETLNPEPRSSPGSALCRVSVTPCHPRGTG